MKHASATIQVYHKKSPHILHHLYAELNETESLCNSIMGALNTVFLIAITDEHGTIEYVNHKLCKVSGFNKKHFIGQNFNILESVTYEKVMYPDMLAAIESRGVWRDDVKECAKDGHFFWVDAIMAPLAKSGERAKKFITVMQVITERKKIEEKLIVANKELETFNFTVSHDLRTPLRAMEMFAAIIMKRTYDHTIKDMLSKILVSAEEMRGMINKMLELSRIGWKTLHKTEVDMQALVMEAFETQCMMWEGKHIELVMNDIPCIKADKVLIKAVWANLISNAIKYSSKQETVIVEIRAVQNEHTVEYSVKDNGVGFDQKYSGKLFKTFSRLHSSQEFKGLGAGLSIVEKIVRIHEGSVHATASVGAGATFSFCLPA